MAWDKLFNYLEDFEPKYAFIFRLKGLVAAITVGLSYLIVNNNDALAVSRFNFSGIFWHTGNLVAVVYALIACFAAGYISARFLTNNKSWIFCLALSAGALSAIGANIMVESASGMRTLGLINVSDPLDIVWGSLLCTLACLISFKVKTTKKDN